jgi:cyclohexa-1,5-dienecarbonyl-CoA hydratase
MMATQPTPLALQVWRERDNKLLRLRLARPKANIVDAAMIRALDAALAGAAADPHLRAVLLDAEGPNFSFGASVQEHLPDQCAAMLKAIHGLVLRMLDYPAPILVAIRGQCLGGGLEVAMSGHLLFAAPDSRLGQPEIQLAVFPPPASCLLPERIGLAQAEDLIYSGRSITGEEAFRIGLVNSVAPDPEAAALAYYDEHLGKRSASSLRLAVRAVRAEMVERVRAKLARVEALYLNELMATRDAVEGLQAFLQKRAPVWEDR